MERKGGRTHAALFHPTFVDPIGEERRVQGRGERKKKMEREVSDLFFNTIERGERK